jgi:iron(III) transport system permease protein
VRAGAAIAAAILGLPIATIAIRAVGPGGLDALGHLAQTALPGELAVGALVAIGASALAALLALGGLASSIHDFPGRALLDRLALLPMLVPSWYLALVARELGAARGLAWLVLVLGVSGAPLVHLVVGAALRAVPSAYGDVLRLAGRSRAAAWHLAPLAFPALGATIALVALAAWADAPSARVLGVRTATVSALDQWSAREDASVGALLGLAVALPSLLVGFVALGRVARLGAGDDARASHERGVRVPLEGPRALLPWLLALPQLALGVVVPGAAIGAWTMARMPRVDLGTLGADAARTILVAGAGTILAGLLALPIVHAIALAGRGARVAARLALLPFALPTVVLAVAVLWMTPGTSPVLAALADGVAPLVFAFGVHGAAVFVGAGLAALERAARGHVAVLRLVGRAGLGSFVAHLRPALGPSLGAAAAFVFLQALDDVSLSIVLAPFGAPSVAARVFQLAQVERVRDTAVWMTVLALLGVYPLVTLARLGESDSRR